MKVRLINVMLLKRIKQLRNKNKELAEKLAFLKDEYPLIYAPALNDARVANLENKFRKEIQGEYEEKIETLNKTIAKLKEDRLTSANIAFLSNPNCGKDDFIDIISTLKNGIGTE